MLKYTILTLQITFILACLTIPSLAEQKTYTSHTLSQFSTPRYSEDFVSFDYVNPDAPKGGRITLGEPGSFNSLNGLILRGVKEQYLSFMSDTLMVKSGDELDVAYGLLAKRVEYPDDKSWVRFYLHENARYHDNQPITTNDFVYAWDMIQQHGRPFLQAFLTPVKEVKALNPHTLEVSFHTTDDIQSLINFAITVSPLPQHWWQANGRDISKTTLEPILGSGPYRITSVDAGRSIIYERVKDYWGRDLPVNRGRYNFDQMKIDYYRDEDVRFEAFKARSYDIRQEFRAQWWAEGYEDLEALETGEMRKVEISHRSPIGAQGFYFNTRREKFQDIRVREALGYLFDFEWINKTIFYDQYVRVRSNFPNSEFGVEDQKTPTSEELEVMKSLSEYGHIPLRAFSQAYIPPTTDGSGNIRQQRRKALSLFAEAGWVLKQNQLVHSETGEVMRIEFLIQSKSGMTHVINPYILNLKKAGIEATVRSVEQLEYKRRQDIFDFDIITIFLSFQAPPGPSLQSYFSSKNAQREGSANYPGIKDPIVDILIQDILEARSLEHIRTLTRVLDRILLWNYYMVPHWYIDYVRLAYWDKFGRPEKFPHYAPSFIDRWWEKQ